ncbi:MAG: two-component regulator propeller domain-containing protein [Mucilaginibacter sp.]|uniref:hybrid sensor histidine kinase/response regulator transcription factor n=1 Tax=Mucilaginibacter sp. TaxID=1882438 RepID=UPI0031ABC5D7
MIFTIISAKATLAQILHFKFTHINISQGISNSTIETIYQDSKGYMWFGTRDGLNRYDGYQVKVFKNQPNDPKSISNNFIKCIYEDAYHNLWIGTTNGLNRFNPYKNTFERYKHNPLNKESISGNDINCLYTDKRGTLWVGTNGGGLSRFDFSSNQFKHFEQPGKQSINLDTIEVNHLFEDSKNNFWLATDKGVSLLNRDNGQLQTRFNINGNTAFTIDYSTLRVQEDKQGNIWLGTLNKGLIRLNMAARSAKQFLHDDKNNTSISTDLIRSLLIDNKGNVWVGGINGSLDLFNVSNSSFAHAQNEPGNPLSISQKTISSMFEDNQNNLWIGTHRAGINFYAPLADKFQLLQEESSANSLSYNDVKSFYSDHRNNIWVGTDGGGLNLYNTIINTFTHYKYNAYNSNSISSDAILSINEDKHNNLWIGTWGGGLNLMNRESKTFTHFTNNPANSNSISSNYVQTTLEDTEGNFWVATYYGGLNLFDTKTHLFKRVTSDLHQTTSLYGNNIISLNEDNDKNLWIGTDDGGLNCYSLLKKTFTHYFVNGEKTPDIRVIFTDSKGRVWIGQTGLYLFNKAEGKFDLYTQNGGLATEFIKGITEDEQGNLWISTSNGLTKLNPTTNALKKYNIADGLQGLEFEAGAYMKTPDGEMYFGGTNGFNRFYPKNIKVNQFVAPVYITGLQIFNQNIVPGQKDSPLQNDISLTHEVKLDHKQSTLSFDFAVLNYTASQNNQYAYKLAGFDKTWHYTSDRKANYTNLDAGKYTFYVKASNNDGIWNTRGTYINIIISPPFWSTWWFRILILLVGSAISYYLLRFKKNLDLQKIEENKREEMHKIQLQFFTNISHEFRTPLSLILGPLEKMMQEDARPTFHQYYDTIHRNANRLLLLINELMDFRKAETGSLKLKVMPGNLNLFIAEVAEDFKSLASQKQINLRLLIQRDLGETWFDRQIIEKIIINLIHNAYKYTTVGGEITVELYSSPTQFETQHKHQMVVPNNFHGRKYVFIRISDNGIGISKDSIQHLFERYYRITDAHMGSGVGLAFVKSLTLIHKGSISAYSTKNVGTDFIVSIPVDRADYTARETWMHSIDNGGVQLESISAALYQTEYKATDEEPTDQGETANKTHLHKILIVDDNNELRNFLYHSLNEFYEVIEAVDGVDGLAKAEEELPDMIISDLMMPNMNGMDFCKKIKSGLTTSQIPFIILSAKDALESKIEGVKSGADLYFPKPVSINLLLLSINNIFEQREALKEKHIKNYFFEAQETADSQNDQHFMDQLIHLIESQLSNSDLDVEFICREMGMSKTKLYHKIKKVSGLSIGEFVRTFRLKKAAYIISHEDILLTDVMYRVGIQTQSYFTKAFKKEFGKTPSQFLNEIKTGRKS